MRENKFRVFICICLFLLSVINAFAQKPATLGIKDTSTPKTVSKPTNIKQKSKKRTKSKAQTTRQIFSINPTSVHCDQDGGYYEFFVNSNNDWDILTDTDWSVIERNGNNIDLVVPPNYQYAGRSDWFEIESMGKTIKVNISQEGKPEDFLTVTPTNIYVNSDGGQREIYVSSSGDWRVSMSAASWVGLTRSGNLLSLNIRPNTYSNARTDYFEISCGDKKQRINVRQEGHKEDYISTSKSYISAPSQGGTYQIDVTSSGYWNISVNPYSWGHLSKSGNTLYLTIDPNDNYSSRSDSFILKCGDKSATVSIYQSAKSNPSSGSSYSSLSSTTSKQHYKTSGYDLYPRRFWGVSFGYIQKEWITKIDNKKYRHGLNGSSEGLHGIQAGVLFEPYFKFGLGLRTGLYGEYLVNKNKEEMSVIDANLYMPLHMSFRARFGQFHLFCYGGVGADFGLYSSFHTIINDHYQEVKNVWDTWLAPDWKRFNASYEFGGGFRYKALQLSFTKSIGFIDMSHTREYKVTQDKPMQINMSFMF